MMLFQQSSDRTPYLPLFTGSAFVVLVCCTKTGLLWSVSISISQTRLSSLKGNKFVPYFGIPFGSVHQLGWTTLNYVGNKEFLFSHNSYFRQGIRKMNHDGSIKCLSSPALLHYYTGKVDYSDLGIREIVSGLPVFLDIFPMREAKLNERRHYYFYSHYLHVHSENLTVIFTRISLIHLVALNYFFLCH